MTDDQYVYLWPHSTDDPRIKRLSVSASVDWWVLITLAGRHGEIIPFDSAIDALSKFKDYTPATTAAGFAEMEEAELIEIDGDKILLLARGDLWALPGDLEGLE